MRFELDETAQAAVQAATAVLDAEGLSDVGTTVDADLTDRTWKALGQSGLLTLSVPERLGGEEADASARVRKETNQLRRRL